MSEDEATALGREHFKRGVDKFNNPFDCDEQEALHAAWHEGWGAAAYDASPREHTDLDR